MREIKFRVYDSEENKIMQVESIDWTNDLLTANEGDNSITDNLDMFTLMQYTGLKDKKGVEIYEGDIVKSFYHRDASGKDVIYTKDVVEIELNEFIGKIGFEISFYKDCEVIGNIHENPELLCTSQST